MILICKLIVSLTDLTPLFNWNTKQLFLYLGAEYTNAQGVCNLLFTLLAVETLGTTCMCLRRTPEDFLSLCRVANTQFCGFNS